MQVKTLLSALTLTLALTGTALTGAAQASSHGGKHDNDGSTKCGNSAGQWISVADAKGKAAAQGYQVRRIKREDGCYELYAISKTGQRLELYMNPVSGKIVTRKNKS